MTVLALAVAWPAWAAAGWAVRAVTPGGAELLLQAGLFLLLLGLLGRLLDRHGSAEDP